MSELIPCIPFILLLMTIAIFPLFWHKFWERFYPSICLGFALWIILTWGLSAAHRPLISESIVEYFSFIALIGSLYVVAGGIFITVRGEATALANTLFLFVGALLANILGTTGASMVLVRPYFRMNRYRLTAHHVVFFIFIVSNVGGSLTPIGDPPLFLGYLEGVPFFWVLRHLWPAWLFGVMALLGIFYVIDLRNFLRAPKEIRDKETAHEEWKIEGLRNFAWLALILAAVFIKQPHFLREIVMLGAAVGSYVTTPKHIHQKNSFNFHPIREVAILFAAIFVTMTPALEWLAAHGASIGLRTPGQFYWASGILSSVLDNAPTYLNFLYVEKGLFSGIENVYQSHVSHLAAISVGAVFFGAMTYIGNGPNFLVKSIAEQEKVKTPSFFGFVFRYSAVYLLPVLLAVWILFFRAG